ncbi:cytochrome-c peroxidase [Actibacterium ureilyticum]|uniref:cytochrome-c peroxidase n=1 Tax=Actibacterium ureilyticum TaxID=1590614 RepID=UPI000BAAF76E|nr:cytochrome c peroxidase [Actibacterium ureilyticum]
MIRALALSLSVLALAVQAAPEQIAPANCVVAEQGWAEAALQRSLSAPLGLPPVPHPADNPPTRAKIELGRKLFFDRRLSINKTMSCAMCHVPEQGFANWELATAVGVEGRSVNRNAPTLINVGYLSPLFHDGRDVALETQFVSPMTARNEMANPSIGHVVALLGRLPDYRDLFADAFGAGPSLDRIGQALGAYQRTLVAGDSPFDRWYFGGDEAALGADAQQGFALFTGKAGCAGCHTLGDRDALFTDQLFHDTGYGRLRAAQRDNPPETVPVQVAPGVVHNLDFARVLSVSARRDPDLGRYAVTEDPADRWTFRTPGLRNLAVTPPYMHDGGFSTLAQVIDFYDRGGRPHPAQDPAIRPLGLDAGEKRALEAFLLSLTSDGLGCLVGAARTQPPDNH